MFKSKNWNKKIALFASGLVCSLCFRIPISTASFCIMRFNLDPSYLNIFTIRIVNGMLIGQVFGNWLGVIFTALGGAWKLWVVAVSNWLCLISFSFSLFSFVNSDEGHLTEFYWSLVVVNFFAKVSDAQCLEIAAPDSTNWYVSTFSVSPIYILLTKTLLLKLINWTDEQNTLNKVTAISTHNVKTTVDYRAAMWLYVITITLTALLSVLWTVVFIREETGTGKIDKNNIASLKSVTGIVIGTILSVPGGLLGVLIASPINKCFMKIFSEAVYPNVVKWCPIILCTLSSLATFAFALGIVSYLTSEYESWLTSSVMSVSMDDHGKYLGIGLGGGLLLGLCFGAIAVRFKANVCKRTVLGLAGGSVLGVALGIVIYEILVAAAKLKESVETVDMDTDEETEEIEDTDQLNEFESDPVNAVPKSSQQTVEVLLENKVDVKGLPTFSAIESWADLSIDGDSTRINQTNNKWAIAFQHLGKVNVTRRGNWDLPNARLYSSGVTSAEKIISLQFTFFAVSSPAQNLAREETERIKRLVQESLDQSFPTLVSVKSVTGKGTGNGKVEFSVGVELNKKWDSLDGKGKEKITDGVQGVLKEGKIMYSTVEQWDFKDATVSNWMAVKLSGSKAEKNKVAVIVNKVIGTAEDDTLEESEQEKIKDHVQQLFDRELGSNAVKVVKIEAQVNKNQIEARGNQNQIEARVKQKQISIVMTLSNNDNVWTRAFQKMDKVVLYKDGFWDFADATVALGGVTQERGNRLEIDVNLKRAKKNQAATEDGKEELEKALQNIFDARFGNGAVTVQVLKAEVRDEGTIKISVNIGYKDVWTEKIRDVGNVKVKREGGWEFSKAKVDGGSVKQEGDNITITVTDVKGAASGQTMDSTEEVRIKNAVQDALSTNVGRLATVTSATVKVKKNGVIVFDVMGNFNRFSLNELQKNKIKDSIYGELKRGRVTYFTNVQWNLLKANVDLTKRAVKTKKCNISITATDVGGAEKGDMLEKVDEKKMINRLQEALNKKVGEGLIRVKSVTGKGVGKGKVEFKVGVEKDDGKNKDNEIVDVEGDSGEDTGTERGQEGDRFEAPTSEPHSLQNSEVIVACVCSIIMNVFSLGTVYSIYPGMAPCSIADLSYFNRIDIAIQIVSAITPIVIIYVSETSAGPEKRWEGEAKGWYVGLLFVMIQNVCMIIVVFVLHCPDNKLANVVTMSPVVAGVLTVTMVTCQVVSTNIGYAGVVANSGYTMMTLNNTATITIMVIISLFGEGYLTELKKYEPGKWPTQGMGKWEAFSWWNGRAFINAWLGLLCIFTTDLRRNIMLSANNNQ